MDSWGVGAAQPGDEKALGGAFITFQYLKGTKKGGEGLWTRVWNDGTRGVALN